MKKLYVIIVSLLLVVPVGDHVLAIHKTIPAETESTETMSITIQPVRSSRTEPYKLKALINLLEKKGLITKEELQKETERLAEKE
ncbi:MAG: hypothetical protein V3V59_03235 [Thermodesulfovibrionales bacterium]